MPIWRKSHLLQKAPGNCESALWHCISLIFSRFYINYILEYVPGFFDLEGFWDSFTLVLVSAVHSFLLLSSIPLCGYTQVYLWAQLKDVWIVSSFWLLGRKMLWALLFWSCMDICFQFSGLIPSNGITELYTKFIFILWLSKFPPKCVSFYTLTSNI